jgi:hypothetical protein
MPVELKWAILQLSGYNAWQKYLRREKKLKKILLRLSLHSPWFFEKKNRKNSS